MSRPDSQRRIDLEATMDEYWQNRAEVAEADVERLRTALLTISTADDPAAPISRATCAAVATAALTGEQS